MIDHNAGHPGIVSPHSAYAIAGTGHWDPLGVSWSAKDSNVALWAPGAERVELCVFDKDGHESRLVLPEQTLGVHHGRVRGLEPGTHYGFRVYGPWNPAEGQRWNPHKLLIDPYARALDGNVSLNPAIFGSSRSDDLERQDDDSSAFVPRSLVVDESFDWSDDYAPRTPWTDTVIYETHVRGITMNHPDVPDHLRGTYAGLAHPAVTKYLCELGVTAVELMPVHHFTSEVHLLEAGLTNYWGYNTLGYFAPHAHFSASGGTGSQVREFKEMVKALHKAGLEVILDVVYNHTAEEGLFGPTFAFRGIDNTEYYRLQDGRYYTDYTGCGNTLDLSTPHVLQMVMDSLRYWVESMHVDGFRFDLASALARSFHDVDMLGTFMTTIQQDPILRRVKLIAEPWDVGPGGYQVGEFPAMWREWNGKFRDCLRDFWRGNSGVTELGWRLSGSADLYASEGRSPYASINFITAHDGFTLRDLVTYAEKHNEANLEDNRDGTNDNRSANYGLEGESTDVDINRVRHRQMRNMLTTLLLSTGVPMLSGGDEWGRTQRGNNNAYCQDNEISWYEWDWLPWQQDLHDFATRIIQLRRNNRVFRQRFFFQGVPQREGGAPDLGWLSPAGTALSTDEWNSPATRTIGMYLSGDLRPVPGESAHISDSSFLLLIHAGEDHCGFTIPGAPYGNNYRRVFDTHDERPTEAPWTDPAGATIMMAPRSCVLLRIEN
jgi:glycogen operon protein